MKKLLWVCMMVLIAASVMGTSEFLIVYSAGLSLRGEREPFHSTELIIDVPSSIMVNSFIGSHTYDSLQLIPKDNYRERNELQKWLGKRILWRDEDGSLKEYQLISANPVVLKGPEGYFSPQKGGPVFPEITLPNPNAQLNIQFPRTYSGPFQYNYLFNGLGWKVFYNLHLGDDKTAFLSGNVELSNQTDMHWITENLYLFSGEIFRAGRFVSPPVARSAMMMMDESMVPEAMSVEGYRLYPVEGRVELPPNTTSYQPFIQSGLPYRKTNEYVAGSTDFTPLDQIIQIKQLPFDLPAGLIRSYTDLDGKVIFVGEYQTTNKNKNEELDIPIGRIYDLMAKREMIDSARFGKTSIDSYRITIRNFAEETRDALIKIPIFANAQITVDHHAFTRPRADLVLIVLETIHPLQTIEINYEIRFDR